MVLSPFCLDCHALHQAEFEAERADLEKSYKNRLRNLKDQLEDDEVVQKRKMQEASDSVLQEFKKQMQVGSWLGCFCAHEKVV